MLTIKFHWPNLISMYKVKTETVPAASLSKFQKPAYPYPTNFLKLNYIKPASKLSRSNYRISVRSSPLEWVSTEKEKWKGNRKSFLSIISSGPTVVEKVIIIHLR